jgi:hypothetical protein
MTIEEKIEFLKTLTEKWSKEDPIKFMDSDELEKLDKYFPEDNIETSEETVDLEDTEDTEDTEDIENTEDAK